MEAEGIHESKRPRMGMEEEANLKVVSGLRPWQDTSSRIIRVSRVSGGKDRHSKVWTAKGLRDRRVRLSVSTAIQFYDLQDRLGYDQPSKAVDWLISAAAAAIADLPELDSSMSLPPPMLLSGRSKNPNGGASGDQQLSQSKSTCSTASDTSKGSVLSLSRREIGSKAKERAREKAAKEKENDSQHQNMNNQSSFTDLLTAGGCGDGVADCFGQGGFLNCTFRVPTYPSLVQLESNPHMAMGMMAYNASSVGEHQEMQHFSFLQDHVLPVAAAATTGDYDLNVSISSSFAGINRGTLQSNSPHQHHLVDGTNLPFFFGAPLPVGAAAGTSSENQLPVGFNGRLHLCCVHPDIDGERKG